jgi:phenylalanyl-tRNA synthetase beta chain
MRVPLSWLAEYVPLRMASAELAHRLTMAGVESTHERGASAGWDNVFVGLVVGIAPHPNADRLRLVTVDIGGERPTVVCGAPNVKEGHRIAFANVGAKLRSGKTGEPMELTATTIRGVESAGMVCSAMELGISDEHEGILVLPEGAPIGTPLAQFMPDDVLEIEVTANRGDCLSVLGIAHEVAAITGVNATEPLSEYPEGSEDIDSVVQVRIEDPELCYRYAATAIRGVKVGPSPAWMQRFLVEAGQKPINNVVDVTNFVMLEYGQPLHAFDLAQVRDNTVIVRAARENEEFTTLDGESHIMQPPMLLIADPERAIAVAGVMGGINSEITDATTDLLIESATFNGINTRRTAFALRNRTEASLRFEKGLNPELAERAVKRATALILETAGGTALRGISDTFPGSKEPPKILFTNSHMRRVLGTMFQQQQVIEVLRALGFSVDAIDEEKLLVSPPYWRSDVAIEEDLIEEVARTIGYDLVPESPLGGQMPPSIPQPERLLREELRDLLVQAGMQETISYSLVSRSTLEQVGGAGDGKPEPLHAANPMSREQEYLRTSLRGSLLKSASVALRHPPGNVALFEIGRVFIPRDNDLPDEQEKAVGVFGGLTGDSLWADGSHVFDFYEAKGAIQTALERLAVNPTFVRGSDDLMHPGRTATVLANGQPIGVVGELHPSVVSAFDFPTSPIAMFEIDVAALAGQVQWLRHHFEAYSRYPSAVRDLALVVDETVTANQLQTLIDAQPLVVRSTLFDLFSGKEDDRALTAGKKSIAYHLELQSVEGTLTPEQLTEAVSNLVALLEKEAGATLRQ